MEIAYKVLQFRDGKLLSYNVNGESASELLNRQSVIEYLPDQIIRPKVKGTKLFIFKTLSAASSITRLLDGNQIWQVAVNKIYEIPSTKLPSVIYCGDLADTWKDIKNWGIKGTYKVDDKSAMCDSLALIKRIQ